ncbi:hypothetical protein GCM10027059_50070 [Myceligenerans halotolerans]
MRRLVALVAPDGEVHQHRTDTVHVYLDPAAVFRRAGMDDLYMREWQAAMDVRDLNLCNRIREVRDLDLLTFGQHAARRAAEHAIELGVRAPVVAHNTSERGYQGPTENQQPDPLAETLAWDAQERTVLPMTGCTESQQKAWQGPAVYPEGRTYIVRARELIQTRQAAGT